MLTSCLSDSDWLPTEQSLKPLAPTGIEPVQCTCAVWPAVLGTTRVELEGVELCAAGMARPKAMSEAPARATGKRRMSTFMCTAGHHVEPGNLARLSGKRPFSRPSSARDTTIRDLRA